ncbi:ABC transporter ATP-binding protein [Mycoplasma bradburyae]|uniref:ABC transporter ATP-binding protein n=1 Tax=Mycoplasma bradburyae TaxID=2963128 RepID=A0AAW6HRP1_9MOLU|nr:ABC transporter ATP-binding protein [Mycoplasma bradburyae]MDC4163089.1 ABC transporter ATP-binding protein [Mycoplasma bradburyae]MDC4181680.1 ABC transporter ATP-binding protein [Mycoplasma bradburyae]MDC4182406.1 ABC transporter ATP-binding protein [Mycoplasma bradburyae]MDC4183134.1 ABC transporter ATP-binding protein [Mycoplasma bradburyae]MDC4183857.1 ABC transporter ATP-binding protein [Mycoplasma bradburyae]
MSTIQSKENKKPYIEVKKKFFFFKKRYARYNIKGVEEMLKVPSGKEILASLRNVDITYGVGSKAFRAVVDMNLNIYKGEVLGLVGESGSGKSTIGRAIIGLVPHSFGQIKILDKVLPQKMQKGFKFGKSLREYKEIENFMVNKVQMIFQDPANSLNPHVNVESIVSEGLTNLKNAKEIYLYNVDQDVIRHIYETWLDKNTPAVYQAFYNGYEVELENLINQNEHVAFEAIYTGFYNKLKEFSQFKIPMDYLLQQKEERIQLSKLSELECKRILVRNILASVGLDESVLKRYPLEFSGGQQQRIGISRAVVVRPRLLIADEPISALDVSIQAQVVNIFNDLKNKFNLTILFIAHDLRMVEYISDRIAVMNKGRLLEIGLTKEIMKNSLHPYTKSLLDAVPSINGTKGSLIGYKYDPSIHSYDKNNQPEWQKINDNHFVLATKKELEEWKQGKYK